MAHSLGSVVVYEVLWAHPDLRVNRLVTLGSPLGMPGVVFDRLDPAPGQRGSRPPGVSEWVNWDFHIVRSCLSCADVAEATWPGR
ncbi:hypothetical protein [Nonomuraea rubra]|uniref:Pimeloyl-ACP methyl ester carboxylesterase n=1 Tax=Nonomuraea rubra TaxID=46180 RepID=A0A7X0TXF2_9ACTN|nr:hypothetical protein [Nonomuraea rubra]MBB6547170.1 pimeloyl-ACP methyl ester carboxylesterase [Nonomuraea rubra]